MVPFLVLFADQPDTEPEFTKVGNETIDVAWFHTRCGHPRFRDD